ncbi:MAG TPA: DUF86 domain-containing protein [Candidatus Hydrogenedentes bacterium]|nr:DUF86 domain-containing protein [Candidatus Hydrogenedentota bacterium]HNT87323.1 DUF86 domain-containing protein [Candidatus Hydrogenedentota bacterium]
MPPDNREMAWLWDMLDAARTAVAFTQDLRFEAFLEDRRTRNAVERNFEILGEAARRISDKTRGEIEEIPWRSIIGLRNIVAHEYGEIRYEILWNVCRENLPSLIRFLESMGVDSPPSAKDL